MKLNAQFYLKWLSVKDFDAHSLEFVLVNECLLYASDELNNITGLTVFAPRDFNERFMERLQNRLDNRESKDIKFKLLLPSYLNHRCETLLKKFNVNEVSVEYSPYLKVRSFGSKITIQNRIRVMNVDDSPVVLKLLKRIFDNSGFIEVVNQCSDSTKAVENILKLRPDIVTMDMQMPHKNGLEVVKELMGVEYFPVILISSLSMEDGTLVFDALNAGAFDYVQKPKFEDLESFEKELFDKMYSALGGRGVHTTMVPVAPKKMSERPSGSDLSFDSNTLWCLGASTGGTYALTEVFTSLPNKIPATIVVQHIPPMYSKAFADSLNNLCPFQVKEAVPGEIVKANCVYIAPGGMQMGVEKTPEGLAIKISDAPPVNRFKPSVDFMFESVSKIKGYKIVAGLLTGMGKDGAQGLLKLKQQGSITFAQDEKTCSVYGMPRAAFELGATDEMVALGSISSKLIEFSKKGRSRAA